MALPVILQADRSECGLACLTMIAGYFGYRSTLRELRAKFRVSLRGTTLASLRDYGAQLGLTSRALRLDPHELAQLRTPAILHWDLDHYVVLKTQNSRNVTIVDPAVGTRRLGMDDFSSHFTGVALEFSSTPAIPGKGRTPRQLICRRFCLLSRGWADSWRSYLHWSCYCSYLPW